jgi:tRNA(Ile)-lysidine synthase
MVRVCTDRPLRTDPRVRAILRSWRSLTGGSGMPDDRRRTLIACSGGADSSALTLALATRPDEVVVGHVIHDLRSRKAVLADRDAVRRLAGSLGLTCVEAEVRVRDTAGNLEANARRKRYAALARLARDHGCRYVAVAHQGDDLAETVLMRLLRGAGPTGLGAMRARRKLCDGIVLVRPMLSLTRTDTEDLCRKAGVRWRTDATNRDETRLRAAIRARVMPVLRRVSPGFEKRIARSANLLADAGRLIRRRARAVVAHGKVVSGSIGWDRERLRVIPSIVLGEALRLGAAQLMGQKGQDRLTANAVMPIVAMIRSDNRASKRFRLGKCEVTVSSRTVRMERAARR